MSSSVTFPDFVTVDSVATTLDPRNLDGLEAIIDSWFPNSATDSLLIGTSPDAQMLDTTHSGQLPFSPHVFLPAEDVPLVGNLEGGEGRFLEPPLTTTAKEESSNEVSQQVGTKKMRYIHRQIYTDLELVHDVF
jgi:hypothetical protein